MPVALSAINDRWRDKNLPYARPHSEDTAQYGVVCPVCDLATDPTIASLATAMSEALAHKNQCPGVRVEMDGQ